MSSMLEWVLKSAMLLAGLSSAAVAAGADRDNAQWVQDRVAQTFAAPPGTRDPLGYTLDEWKRLQGSDSLPFDSYAGFLLAHPGWPGESSRRAAAEATPSGPDSPASAVRFFDRYPPLTGAGHVRYATALLAVGRRDSADDQARKAWRKGALRPSDEAQLLGTFSYALGPDDHDTRMDMLLWQGATSAAARQLGYTSPARRAIFDARLAYRTNAADAMSRGLAIEAQGVADAGFIADRANWMRGSGSSASARAQLARPHSVTYRPGMVEKWYEVLLTNARAALADRQFTTAYDIARQVDDAYPPGTDVSDRPLGERDDYTSLTWLAGTTALEELRRPRDAIGLFERYSRGSRTPATRSKGLYWAGRAAEAAGDRAAANGFYAGAAAFPALFYGQLAAERLSQPIRPLAPVSAANVDPALRAGFAGKETVRAVKLLGALGRWDDQSAFVRQIAADAASDSDHALAAELSRTINRPDLGVMTGRAALQAGFNDYAGAGFPTVRVPANSTDYWTIVHAIARQETQFNRKAVSHAGARGMMQLMPGTAREQAGKLGLAYNGGALTEDTDYNIHLGSSYFARIYAMYGNYPMAVAAYNAGAGNVNKWVRQFGDPRTPGVDVIDWIEAIPFYETKNYVQRVLENAVVYDLMNPQHARSRGPANLSWYLGKRTPG